MATKVVQVELASGSAMWINPESISSIKDGSGGLLSVRFGDGYFEIKAASVKQFCEYLRIDPGFTISDD